MYIYIYILGICINNNIDRPTNTILIRKLTPKNLGSLIALYEHKIFSVGVILNLFSFDQFGVELGKQLANKILSEFGAENNAVHDSSTTNLINHFEALK